MQSASSAGVVLGEDVRASAPARVLYRPDIDGLRAISVLAVILFHSAVPGFGGGYVGVDVFFVISGYLITQVLMASPEHSVGDRLRDSTFAVAGGSCRHCSRRCSRRCGRMLAVSAQRLVALRRLLSATSLFVGNVVAWRSGGYFEIHDPSFNPLAHLWSLAVEEQFYIVFPLFFWRAARLETAGSSR